MSRLNLLTLLRATIFIAALLCICTGLCNGEAQMVLRKAVRVCLECIGVG